MKKQRKKMKKIFLLTIYLISLNANELISCYGCHGENFEKKAMGKSKIVKNMSKEDILKSLKGYKNKNYGGDMKNIMENQIKNVINLKNLSDKIYLINHKKETIKLKKEMKKNKTEKNEIINISDFTERKLKCLEKSNQINKCMEDANNPKEMRICIKEFQKLSFHFSQLLEEHEIKIKSIKNVK